MSDVTRRALLGGAATLTGGAVAPSMLVRSAVKLHIFDSRFGVAAAAALAYHDIATEDASLWRASRNLVLQSGDRVTGVTRWSDWVSLRGLFSERGLRTSGVMVRGNLATWEMS
jgi:hypothetical protein